MVALAEEEVFTLKGPQRGLFYDDRPFLYYKGGRGVGKTVSACMRIAGMIDRGELRMGARILVMGPTYPQLKDGTLKSFDKWMGADGLGLITARIDGNEPSRKLVNNITAYFRNASNPDQTRGHEVQCVWLDEAAQMRKDILQMTNPTLRQFGAHALYQTICTSTPRGKNWLYATFVNPETRMDENELGAYHITTIEAERIGIARPGYIAGMNIIEGSAWWRQEILGEEVAFTGNVFHYEPERDSPIPFILPAKFKTVVGGIDIGTTAPTAVVLIGLDEVGRYWVFREYYQRRADFHEVLRLIGEWDAEFKVRFWAIDAAANLEAKMMRSAGFPVRNSLKAKDAAGTTVNFINSLMERGMFRISPDCVAGIMELQNYEHKEQQSGDEVTFLDKVKPDQPDHFIDACFVAGTPVITEHGEIPIEQVATGDFVLTRKGYRRVLHSAMTDPLAYVLDLLLSNGQMLTGTGDHPIWVDGRGWVRLDALRYGDKLFSWDEQNPSPSMASSFAAIPTQNGGRIASTLRRAADIASAAWGAFMRKSGRSATSARSRKGITSTTSISTSITTGHRISSASLPKITGEPTQNDSEPLVAKPDGLYTWNEYDLLRNCGMAPLPVFHGTVNRLALPTLSASHWNGTVITAPFATALSPVVTVASAPIDVSRLPVAPAEPIMYSGLAERARKSLLSTVTRNSDSAPVTVHSMYAAPHRQPVYNISVEDAPEFFAHGILVHNCRYAIAPLSANSAAERYGQEVEFSIG